MRSFHAFRSGTEHREHRFGARATRVAVKATIAVSIAAIVLAVNACGGGPDPGGTIGNDEARDIVTTSVSNETVNDGPGPTTETGDPLALDRDTAATRAADLAEGHTTALEHAVESGPYDATCDKQTAAWSWSCHASIPYTPEAAAAIGQDECDLTIDVYNKIPPAANLQDAPGEGWDYSVREDTPCP